MAQFPQLEVIVCPARSIVSSLLIVSDSASVSPKSISPVRYTVSPASAAAIALLNSAALLTGVPISPLIVPPEIFNSHGVVQIPVRFFYDKRQLDVIIYMNIDSKLIKIELA